MLPSLLRPLRTALTLSVWLLCLLPTARAAEPSFHELFCIRIEDRHQLAPHAVPVPQAGAECHVSGRAAFACMPARSEATGSTSSAEGEQSLVFDRLCYRLRCETPPAGRDLVLSDRLGRHSVKRGTASFVCTPAVVTVAGDADAQGAGDGPGPQIGSDSHLEPTTCGDVNEDANFSATDALGILRAAVGSASCLVCICDVDNTATITATDALKMLKFAVGQAVTLNCQADGNPISWDGGGDGFSWTDGSNWSLDRIPNGCDAATIMGAPATVTHASGSNAVRSLLADSDLDLTGGTLTLRDTANVSGLFRLRGATLAGAHVLAPGNAAPLVATSSVGTLDGVTMDADMDLTASSASVNIANGLIVNASATFGQNAGFYFGGSGELPLAGTGEIVLDGPNAQIFNYGGTLRIGPDLFIHGAGNSSVGGQYSGAQMINEGTIDCDVASGTLYAGSYATWSNSGTIGAHNGCTLNLRGGPWSNSGTFMLDGTSTLNLGGAFASGDVGAISRTGGTINLIGQMTTEGTFTLNAATGDWRLLGGTIVGGTIASANGAKLLYTSSNGTLDGVTMDADMDLTAPSASVNIANGLILSASATVGQNAGFYFSGSGELPLAGTGEIVLDGPNAQIFNYGGTLRIGPDLFIHGAGNSSVGGQYSGAQMINEGTIDCDVASGTLYAGSYATWSNAGVLRASQGNLVTRGPWSNDGTIEIGAGRTLNASSGFTQGSAGELALDFAGTASSDFGKVAVTGAVQLGGTLTIALTGGFVPNIGDTFTIMTFASTNGSFATFNGLDIGGGKCFEVTVNATNVTLEVVPS